MSVMKNIFKFVITIMAFFCHYSAFSQSFNIQTQSLYFTEHDGLKITFAPKFSALQPGDNHNLFGSISYTIKLESLGVTNNMHGLPTNISYKGKTYYRNSFGAELVPFFNDLKVITVNVSNTSSSFQDCNKLGGSSLMKVGETLNSFCKPKNKDNVTITITDIKVASMEGITQLKRKIDEIEKQLKDDEEAKKNELSKSAEIKANANKNNLKDVNEKKTNNLNQNKSSNSSDFWYQDGNKNKNESNYTSTQINKEAQERAERERKLQELNNKMVQIEQQRQNLNNASNETTNQWARGNYIEGSKSLAMEFARQGSANAAYGTIAVGTALQIFSVLGQNKKEKEEKERQLEQQRLAREEENRRKLALEKQEEERRELLATTRKGILNLFIAKPYPNSLTKIETNKIYYFIYTKINDFKEENITLKVSNIFAVGKYPDGTWPMQKGILEDLKKVIPNQTPEFCGYFTDEEAALLALNDFIKNMSRVNITVTTFDFKGKNSDVANKTESKKDGETDFWGNPIKNNLKSENNKEIDTKSKQKLDFWGNPIKD